MGAPEWRPNREQITQTPYDKSPFLRNHLSHPESIGIAARTRPPEGNSPEFDARETTRIRCNHPIESVLCSNDSATPARPYRCFFRFPRCFPFPFFFPALLFVSGFCTMPPSACSHSAITGSTS